jgi:Cu-Zn family superoxide dismutase
MMRITCPEQRIHATAVFPSGPVEGDVVFSQIKGGTQVIANFTKMPRGKHGFHIHKAGDLRGKGCQGACDHYHRGKKGTRHGGPPQTSLRKTRKSQRHSGDLGNIYMRKNEKVSTFIYFLPNIPVEDLFGRSVIVHADEDDLGKGKHQDSHTTGHSGKRIACAVIGRSHNCA